MSSFRAEKETPWAPFFLVHTEISFSEAYFKVDKGQAHGKVFQERARAEGFRKLSKQELPIHLQRPA